MKRTYGPNELTLIFLLSLSIYISCNKKDDDDNPVTNAFAIGSSNNLLGYNVSAPAKISSDKPITGLQTGEATLAIDIRPATGQLYGLGSTSRLYLIDKTTAVATVVGTSPFTPVLSGATFGFDFNPSVETWPVDPVQTGLMDIIRHPFEALQLQLPVAEHKSTHVIIIGLGIEFLHEVHGQYQPVEKKHNALAVVKVFPGWEL